VKTSEAVGAPPTGKVPFRLIEFHVVHHCNLTCVGCSHFSPQAKVRFVTEEEVSRDAELAAARIKPTFVHILGGEPLLHPRLAGLAPIFRRSFPEAKIKVVTNGVLVPRVSEALVAALREHDIMLSVSLYPASGVSRERVEILCRSKKITVEFWVQDTFLDFIDPTGSSNPFAARAACPMEDACNVRAGRIYPCPVTAWADFGGFQLDCNDGVSLSARPEEIASVLDRRRITSFCRFCKASPTRVSHRMAHSRVL
jgi:cyclic pyranopterin phosphate synthase